MSELKQKSVSELIGRYSASGQDLKVHPHRSRYIQSTVINANSNFLIKVDRIPGALLDCRDVKMRFTLTLTSTDPDICVAANNVFPFQSVNITCGTQKIYTIDNAALLHSLLYNSTQDNSISAYQQSVTGDSFVTATKATWADLPREYVITTRWDLLATTTITRMMLPIWR